MLKLKIRPFCLRKQPNCPEQLLLDSRSEQQHHFRGDDRQQITRAREAAEALFRPKRQLIEPSAPGTPPAAVSLPRNVAVAAASPMARRILMVDSSVLLVSADGLTVVVAAAERLGPSEQRRPCPSGPACLGCSRRETPFPRRPLRPGGGCADHYLIEGHPCGGPLAPMARDDT